jgi:hypothetical protein
MNNIKANIEVSVEEKIEAYKETEVYKIHNRLIQKNGKTI